jgi:hypothetical protein
MTIWRNDQSAIIGNYGGEAMIDNRTQVFDVAMKNARTIEACLDRLAMMGADHELKLIAGRLSRLTFRAAPFSEETTSAMRPDPLPNCTARE